MTNRKSTKRALLGSVMAMVLCLAMLVGATFAWFTDTASTGVNKIQAGNLDVQLVDENGNSLEGKTLEFKKAANAAEGEAVLWEPGCTYELPAVYVKNNGKLALKYKVAITGINGSAKLNEVIDWTINDADLSADHSLSAGATSEALTIKGHMKESAGNEYMNESIDGIAITVYATQDTVESDSFTNQYDKNAAYPVVNVTELKEALTNGGVVAVTKDIHTNNIEDTAAARIVISQPTTLNLEKKIITPDNMGNNNTNFCALIVDADTTINAGENGGIDTGVNGGYGINVRNGATLTINGGYYYGGGTAVQVQEGTLIINGGTFACEPYSSPTYGYNFLINCLDSAYKNGTAKVIINGGTFVNFDPSNCTAEGAGTNFVADGYKVVSAPQTNGDVWYTVVKG
ncbi:MAG: TasA family protein [Oscillospiraceae bacterium]